MSNVSQQDDPSSVDPLADIVNEFVEQAQSGKNPDIESFCQQYPELADEIRELFQR